MSGFDVLKGELVSLFEGRASEMESAVRKRSATDRVDAVTSVVRSVVSESSVCRVDGDLMYFDGRCYVPVSREMFRSVLTNVMLGMGVGASDDRKVGEMPMSVLADKIHDSDASLVCFDDCVYDIESGCEKPFSADLFVTRCLPYPHRSGGCARWLSFLEEVLPDPSVRACLQEYLGMCFVDRTRISIEKMAIFVGGGANGKSVVFDVMKAVFGRGNVSFLSPDQIADSRQAIALRGKVINFAPDVRRGAAFDSALKAMASSQEVEVWEMYKGERTIKCPPMVFALNEMPQFRDVTDAFFRRVLLFPFDVTIPAERQDRRLAETIVKTELPGIFAWVMEGRDRLVRNGGMFTRCVRMDDALGSLKRRVRSESNPVLAYLDSAGYSVKPVYEGQMYEKVRAKDIFRGMDERVSKTEITKALNALGVKHVRSEETVYYLYRKQ